MGYVHLFVPAAPPGEHCSTSKLEARHVPITFDLVYRAFPSRRLGRLLFWWTGSSSGAAHCDGCRSADRYPATATPTPKPRLPVTARPRVTAAPLTISYEVVEIKRDPGEQATLMLKVNATGGGGSYRYYHDDIAQSGALFKVAGVCGKPFVHTIKVSAANGETVALPYHVSGICPTPTP